MTLPTITLVVLLASCPSEPPVAQAKQPAADQQVAQEMSKRQPPSVDPALKVAAAAERNRPQPHYEDPRHSGTASEGRAASRFPLAPKE